MSENVGLTTPRGSGTSGYVQRNLSHIKARDRAKPYDTDDFARYKQRKPDPQILEHERRRKIEVKVFELRDRLEDEEVAEDEIEKQTSALREKLEKEDAKNKNKETDARGLKSYQVHDLAKAKIEETEKLRKALGIRKDYEEGSYWKRQEEKRKTDAEYDDRYDDRMPPPPPPPPKKRDDDNRRPDSDTDDDSDDYSASD